MTLETPGPFDGLDRDPDMPEDLVALQEWCDRLEIDYFGDMGAGKDPETHRGDENGGSNGGSM